MLMQKASSNISVSLLSEYRNKLNGIERKLQQDLNQLPTFCSMEELPYVRMRFQKMLENTSKQKYICERIAAQLL